MTAEELAEDLATRLVVAIEEQDVLYVLYWLEKMKESNCLEPAINGKHSWKGYSALESIVQSPFTQLRRVILEVLLLHGADGESKEILDLAMEKRNTEVLQVLLNWKSRGREEAVDARRLIEMSLEEAANWIDLNLAPPPNAESLTGTDDPPLRPSHLPFPPVESQSPPSIAPSISKLPNLPSKPSLPESPKQPPTAPAKMRSSPRWKDTSIGSPLPVQPSPPRRRVVETSLSNWRTAQSLQHPEPSSQIPYVGNQLLPIHNSTTRLNFSHIPVNFEQGEFEKLFKEINVRFQIILYRVAYPPTYAFVDVDTNDALYAIQRLNGLRIGDRFLRSIFATSRPPVAPPNPLPSHPPSFQEIDSVPTNPFTSSRCHDALNSPHSAHSKESFARPSQTVPALTPPDSTRYTNIRLLFNLPLDDLSCLSRLAHQLKGNQILRYPAHDQSVMIASTINPAAADRFEKLWDGYLLKGRRLKVIQVREGIEPRDAIEEYFSRSVSRPSDSASSSQRSSTPLYRSRSRSASPPRWRTLR
ncbi:hypothetical protein JCM5353_007503 [Sporobolomyces roseus]